jgi:hypothetical protein
MTLSYYGGVLEMWGQLRLMKVNHGDSVDVTFAIQQDRRSEIRNAVWSMPAHGEAIIAIGNYSNSTANATLAFSNGNTEEITVPSFGTEVIRKQSEYFPTNFGGMTVTAHGSTALIATGVVTTHDGSFTSSIRFYDTENVAQTNLYATNFRLKNVGARMLLRNTGTQTIAAIPRFVSAAGDPNNFIDLPSVTLAPNEITNVDIDPLKAAVAGRPEFDHVSVQVLNSGPRGSLIGALNGMDEMTGMTYDVPLRDIGGIRNSTGAYPWRLDHDVTTVVSITNVGTTPSEFVVLINYPGGPYLLDPLKIAAGGTVLFDLRKIRDEQIPDRNGNTIPLSVKGGQFKWFIHGGGSARLIGRAEMLSDSLGVSSSYSCPGGNCPAMLVYSFLEPGNVNLRPGDEATIRALEIDCDAYWCYGPFAANVSQWELFDPDFSILFYPNGNQADVFGFLGGPAVYQADIGYETYAWDGQQCIDGGLNYATADGVADVLKVDGINPPRGLIGTTVRVIISGKGFEADNTSVTGDDSGISVNNIDNFNVNSTQIGANVTIAANATPGTHHLTVHVGDASATGDFFVQIPKAVRRVDFFAGASPSQETTGIGPIVNLTDGSVLGLDGNVVDSLTHKCGAYRNLLYQLVDQDQSPHPILAVVRVDEMFPADEKTGDNIVTATGGANTTSEGLLQDINGLIANTGNCNTAQSTSGTSKQHFSVTLSGPRYDLTTIITISIEFNPNATPQFTIGNVITTP